MGKRSLDINTDKNLWTRLLVRTPEKRTRKDNRKSSRAPCCGTIRKQWHLSLQRTTLVLRTQSAGRPGGSSVESELCRSPLPSLPPAPCAAAAVLRKPHRPAEPYFWTSSTATRKQLVLIIFFLFWGVGPGRSKGVCFLVGFVASRPRLVHAAARCSFAAGILLSGVCGCLSPRSSPQLEGLSGPHPASHRHGPSFP